MGQFNYKRFLKWALVVVIFACLGRIVWANWAQVREAPFSFQILPLTLSILLFAFSYFIQIWAWYLITLKLGIAISVQETLRSWFYSQLGKYVPGKVWLFLSRFYFYDSKGKSKKVVTVALYYETVTLIMATMILFLASLFFLEGTPSLSFGIPPAGLILLFLLGLLFLHPKILQRIMNVVLGRLRRKPLSLSISYLSVLWILAVCVLSWVIGGVGFYLFVRSVFPVDPRYLLFLTGALAISSTLGLIVLFAPSGLGVREGVLVYLLSSIMPSSVAVILSVLTRLWMTFIEIGLIGMVYIVVKLRKGVERRDRHVKT